MSEQVLLIEDDREDRLDFSEGFKNQGYGIKFADTVAEAVLAAREGVTKFVCDIRLKNDMSDHSGLLFIKPILEVNPRACIVVCSGVAGNWEPLALELGAHGVVAKGIDPQRTVLEIQVHFLKHGGTRTIFQFATIWWGLPMLMGWVTAEVCSRVGIVMPFLSSTGSAVLPLALALVFVLIVADRKGQSDTVIANWQAFTALRNIRAWLFAAILGGFAYDAFKHYLPTMFGR